MLSVVVAPWGSEPVVLRNADVLHDAASTMKVAVLAAVHRSGLDLDARRPVVNEFRSVTGGRYGNSPEWDSDPLPWERLGTLASLRWLAGRMVTHSSNLATNLCLAQVGQAVVARVWRQAGATAGGGSGRLNKYPNEPVSTVSSSRHSAISSAVTSCIMPGQRQPPGNVTRSPAVVQVSHWQPLRKNPDVLQVDEHDAAFLAPAKGHESRIGLAHRFKLLPRPQSRSGRLAARTRPHGRGGRIAGIAPSRTPFAMHAR
ncbi:serine hydrolase [Streptomyces sp. NBC_01431]|uniref:serine hydrolase n=1 Tax=Streptomyces sp. NBC_01431 TaxID=2903863 RepID=UPI002E326C59|nr:serine hydrolase [Streptomyces sp. NBC_01431]